MNAQSISIVSPQSALNIRFDELESVAGDVYIEGDYIDALRMSKLARTRGMTVVGDGGVVALGGLQHVDGDLVIRSGRSALSLPSLETVAGNMYVDSGWLTNFEASQLERVESNLTIAGTLVQAIALGSLDTVGGDVAIVRVPELQSLILSKLTDARSLLLQDNARLSVLTLPALERLSTWFGVTNTTTLSAIYAPLLTEAAQVFIYDNVGLPSCVASNLALQTDTACQCNNNGGAGDCSAAVP